jgi:aminopeptidase N
LVTTARAVIADEARAEDDRRVWLRFAIAAASVPADVSDLADLVAAGDASGLPVDQEMRWNIGIKAVALGLAGAQERVALERERDSSDRGQREVIRAEVAVPDVERKSAAWGRIHGEGYGSDYLTRSALAGFVWHSQRELLLPWRERFFEQVRGVYRTRDLGFAQSYLRSLYPAAWGEPEVVERSSRLLEDLGPDEVQLRRHLLEVRDDLERVIRARAYAEPDGDRVPPR